MPTHHYGVHFRRTTDAYATVSLGGKLPLNKEVHTGDFISVPNNEGMPDWLSKEEGDDIWQVTAVAHTLTRSGDTESFIILTPAPNPFRSNTLTE